MSTVLITGASRGIGRAIALACAASGEYSKVILNGGHDTAALQETSRLVSSAGDLLCVSSLGDVGDLAYVRSLRQDFGPADVLINNAGISWTGLLTDMVPDEDIEKILAESEEPTDDLYAMACRNGGEDNVSIILAKIS